MNEIFNPSKKDENTVYDKDKVMARFNQGETPDINTPEGEAQ